MKNKCFGHLKTKLFTIKNPSKAPSWTAIAGGLVAAVPGQAQVPRCGFIGKMLVPSQPIASMELVYSPTFG